MSFVSDLDENGFALLDLSGDARIMALCDAAIEDARPYAEAGCIRVQDLWRRSSAVRELAGAPAVIAALTPAYGRAPFPFQTLNFHRGSQQPAHSDRIHFDSDPPDFMCGVWLALEDVHPDAGPLTYYPGSHKLPLKTFKDVGALDGESRASIYPERYEPAIAAEIETHGFAAQPALLRKGQALVWAANLLHGGAPVADPARTRRSLVTHYYFEGCDYFTWTTRAARPKLRRLPSDARSGRFVWPRGGLPDTRGAAFELKSRITRRVHAFKS